MGLNLEQNVTLAYAAAFTTRLLLGTAVAVLPIRNPVLNARQLATIDQYSGGRLLYGAGVGWLKEEADAMGMPWELRGARSEEHIALMRSLWTAEDDTVQFAGEFWTLPPISPEPRPVQRPIPVLIGGHSDVALDRAVRIGDGWISSDVSVERAAELLKKLGAICGQYGRRMDELRIVCGVPESSLRAESDAGLANSDDVAAELRRYGELGVMHLNLSVTGITAKSLMTALVTIGEEVLPQLREKTSGS